MTFEEKTKFISKIALQSVLQIINQETNCVNPPELSAVQLESLENSLRIWIIKDLVEKQIQVK